MNRRLGFLCFLGASVLYASFGLFVRALQTHFDVLQQIVLRNTFSSLIIIPIVLATGVAIDRRKLSDRRLIMFALLFPFSIALWTGGIFVGTVRSATFGLYFGSLVGSSIFGKMFFQEQLTSKRAAGVALSIIGLFIFSEPFGATSLNTPSVFLGAAAGLFQALALCLRRWLAEIDRSFVLAAQSLGPLVVCGGYCAIFEPISLSSFSPSILATGFCYGAVVVMVSYLVLYGAQNLEIAKGSIVLSTELFWTTLVAALFLNEIPTMNEIIGCMFLFAAVATIRSDNNSTSPTSGTLVEAASRTTAS